MTVKFEFQTLRDELKAMEEIATPFLATDMEVSSVFGSLRQQLDQIQQRNTKGLFTTGEWQTIRTRPTSGYEPGGHGALTVVGEVSWIWEIIPDGKRNRWAKACGNASIKTRIVMPHAGDEIAMWRTEMGDPASPGCFFHQQILGQHEGIPFPKSLCVPRLPALLVTPMAVLEFLLGELFQDEWREHASHETDRTRFWRGKQQEIVLSLLNWKRKRIESCSGSPWLSLKTAKPTAVDGLFVGGSS